MRTLRIVVVAVLVVLFALAVANWTAFFTPVRLSLIFTEFEVPLGISLLAVTAGVVALFFVYAATLRTAMLLESRRQAKLVEEQRALAHQAELSRFTELRSAFEAGLQVLEKRIEASTAALVDRTDALEQRVTSALDVTTNTMAAHMGQVDDKLERALARSESP